MKKIISALLALCIICTTCFVSMAEDSRQAQITSPSNGEWLDPCRSITIKWSTPESNLNYKITIINDVTKKEYVRNKSVSGSSYTIPANTLSFDERYKIWVGTFDGSTSLGAGDYIYINTSSPSYQEAAFSYPSNNQTISANEDLTLRWSGNSNLGYYLSVKDTTSGSSIITMKEVSITSYTINRNLLTAGHSYKAWIGTYLKSSFEHKEFGSGNSITFKTREEVIATPTPAPTATPSYRAEITSPSDSDWLDPSEKITIKWNTPASGLEYSISIKNDVSGEEIVGHNSSSTTGTSYTIPANTLYEQQRYKVTLLTYTNDEMTGTHTIKFNTNDIDYEEAYYISPSDSDTVNASNKITLKFGGINSNYSYKITILNTEDNEYIVKNKSFSGSSYSLAANTLAPGKEYKLWVGTFIGSDALGTGDTIHVYTEEEEEEPEPVEAYFTSPSDGDWLDSSGLIALKFGDVDSSYSYKITILDTEDNEYIARNKTFDGGTFTIHPNTLSPGKKYKLWIGTFIGSEAIGHGDTIYIYTEEEEEPAQKMTEEAFFIAPEDGDIVDYSQDLTLYWGTSFWVATYDTKPDIDIDACYQLAVKDLTDNTFVVNNKIVTDTSYKIKATQLKPNHEYKAWIGTFDDTSNSKKLIGPGNEIFFSTSEEDAGIKITSLSIDMIDDGLEFSYSFGGNDFGYAYIHITDSDGITYLSTNEYSSSGEYVITNERLTEGDTYICEIQTYTKSGEKSAYKSQQYMVAQSGFSQDGVNDPPATLTYGSPFSIKGTVSSAYPISEAEIVISSADDIFDIKDSVRINNYNKVSNTPNTFNIADYDSQISFGSLEPGQYQYRVSIVDSMGHGFVATTAIFTVVRKKGTYSDVSPNHKNYDAIKQLTLDDVLSGDDTGKFRPDDPITRAEVVKILCCAFDLDIPEYYEYIFSDVPNSYWAWKYIHSAYKNNVVVGIDASHFNPTGNVTYEQIAKMLVCIKGWEDSAIENGGWPNGYTTVAKINEFFGNTSMASNSNYKKNATRAEVAQMVYNAELWHDNKLGTADKIYTVNGTKLYAYKYTSGYYVESASVMQAFNGGDFKEDSELKGCLRLWSNNADVNGAFLYMYYDFSGKNDGYYKAINISYENPKTVLSESAFSNRFKKHIVQMTCRAGKSYVNIEDIVTLAGYTIKGNEILIDEMKSSSEIKIITAKYSSGLSKKENNKIVMLGDTSIDFNYSDSYFVSETSYDNGYGYNHELVKASLGLELSSWTPSDEMTEYNNQSVQPTAAKRMKNILDVYEQIGLGNIEQHNYGKSLSDGSDAVAYSFASKTLYDGSTLVTVVIRGGGYGAEWRSNFNVGTGKFHEGFYTPAKDVYSNLKSYLETNKYDKQNTKIWLTGYSRAAAIGNLVSGMIDDNELINRNNLYSYLFAVPQGVDLTKVDAHNKKYNNIKNIILPYDAIPKVVMSDWGWGRYGMSLNVINKKTSASDANEVFFKEHTRGVFEYSVGPEQTTAGERLASSLARIIPSQKEYVDVYQGFAMDMVEWALFRSSYHKETIKDYVLNKYVQDEKIYEAMSFYTQEIKPIVTGIDFVSDMAITDDEAVFEIVFYTTIMMYMNGIEKDQIVELVRNLLDEIDGYALLFIPSVVSVYNTGDKIYSLVNNAGTVINAHQCEYYLSWLFGNDDVKNIFEEFNY